MNTEELEKLYDSAIYYEEGENGVKQDFEKAFEVYREIAKYHDSFPDDDNTQLALADVARCYYNGIGVQQNYEEALKWYIKAAQYDHDCYFFIAKLYEEGKGTPKDFTKAIEYYKKDRSDEALECIVKIYQSGAVIDKDDENAINEELLRRKRFRQFPTHLTHLLLALERRDYRIDDIQAFINYYQHDFPQDIQRFYNIRNDFGDNTFPFVIEMSDGHYNERSNFHWRGETHRIAFSISIFFMSMCTQVIGKLYGWEQMENLMRSTGWPQLNCGMGGLMHPLQVIYESGLSPSPYGYDEYIDMVELTEDYLKNDFLDFFTGTHPNLNHAAYNQVCNVVKIEDVSEEIDNLINLLKEWAYAPSKHVYMYLSRNA